MYPFIPKSNLKLQTGHFWPIQLSNGSFAAGIVADLPGKKNSNTRHFLAGLLNLITEEIPVESDFKTDMNLSIIKLGQAHIKSITFEGQAIIGRIDLKALNIAIPFQVSQIGYQETARLLQGYRVIRPTKPEDHKIYQVQGFWGYDFINELAELHLVQK